MVLNSSSELEKLSSIFMEVGRSVTRFERIVSFYQASSSLRNGVAEYFILMIQVCRNFKKFTQKSLLGRLNPFDSDLKGCQANLKIWANAIDGEVISLLARTTEKEPQENSSWRNLFSRSSEQALQRGRFQEKSRILDLCSTFDFESSWKRARMAGRSNLIESVAEYHDWKSRTDSCTLIWTGKLGAGNRR